MFDPTMKKKKKKKKVPLDLDALEEPSAPSNVDEKNENTPESENQDNAAEEKEGKEDKGDMILNSNTCMIMKLKHHHLKFCDLLRYSCRICCLCSLRSLPRIFSYRW